LSLGSTPPSEVENTKSDSGQDLLQKIIDTAPQEVLDAYDLAPPKVPEDPMEPDTWFDENRGRFSFQQPQPIDDWYKANKDRFDPVVLTGIEKLDQINRHCPSTLG